MAAEVCVASAVLDAVNCARAVVAFAEQLKMFLRNPRTVLEAAFRGDAEQQKLYMCILTY